jgi:hypothetical protein
VSDGNIYIIISVMYKLKDNTSIPDCPRYCYGSKILRIVRNYKTLNIQKFENKHKSIKTKISNKRKISGRNSEVENQEFLSRRRLSKFYEHPKITKLNKFQNLKIRNRIKMKSNSLSDQSIYIVVTLKTNC